MFHMIIHLLYDIWPTCESQPREPENRLPDSENRSIWMDMTLIERPDEVETIADDGYRRSRADIVLGRLLPGQKLKLDGLKGRAGDSVSALREILSRLASEGL